MLCNHPSGLVDQLALAFGDCRGESSRQASQASDTRLRIFFGLCHHPLVASFSQDITSIYNRNCLGNIFIVFEAK